MEDLLFLDRAHNPVDVLTFLRLQENPYYRRIDEDRLGNMRISTVFIPYVISLPYAYETLIENFFDEAEYKSIIFRHTNISDARRAHRNLALQAAILQDFRLCNPATPVLLSSFEPINPFNMFVRKEPLPF